MPALVALQSGTPATTSAARYATIVEEHALLRRMISTAGEIAEKAYSLPDDVTKAIGRRRVDGVRGRAAPGERHRRPIGDLLHRSLDRSKSSTSEARPSPAFPPATTTSIGCSPVCNRARWSSSALGPAWARPASAWDRAQRRRSPRSPGVVVLAGDEPDRGNPVDSVLRGAGRRHQVRNGRLNEADWSKIHHAVGRLAESQIFIDDTRTSPSWTSEPRPDGSRARSVSSVW